MLRKEGWEVVRLSLFSFHGSSLSSHLHQLCPMLHLRLDFRKRSAVNSDSQRPFHGGKIWEFPLVLSIQDCRKTLYSRSWKLRKFLFSRWKPVRQKSQTRRPSLVSSLRWLKTCVEKFSKIKQHIRCGNWPSTLGTAAFSL